MKNWFETIGDLGSDDKNYQTYKSATQRKMIVVKSPGI
jgi:hypothetical protein